MKPILLVAISCTPLDLREIVVTELEVGRADDLIDLFGPAEAYDRAVDSRVRQRPGHGHRADARVETVCDRPQPFDEGEVLREARLLET
jgi:hypothetical protein